MRVLSTEKNESIMNTVKDNIGIARENPDFDNRLIEVINTCLLILFQEGVLDTACEITDANDKWEDLPVNENALPFINSIIEWVGARARQIFDPPTSSVLANALQEIRDELEWRNFITNNYVGEIGDLYGEVE